MATKQPKMVAKTSDFIPCSEAELRWIFIDQPGKENMQGKLCLNASVYVNKDSKGLVKLKDALAKFWDENKPSGAPKKPKSIGITKVKAKDESGEDILDSDDNQTYTDEVAINFWTGATWPDGKPHVIRIFSAKGNEISLGSKKIGNGSFGSVSFAAGIYDAGKGSQGITLYLNAIQITKFVEYTQEAGFEAEDGDFDGVPTEFDEVTSEQEAKPRI